MRLDLAVPLCGLALLMGLTSASPAVTIAVPADQPTLAAAMLVAAAGDTIQLADGTYQEHGIALVAGVTVRGDPTDPAAVILDAGGLGRVLDAFGLATAPVLSGLTFTGGSTLDGWWDALGGAVRCRASSLVVADCVFTGNEAVLGGGLGCLDAEITITDTVFRDNHGIGGAWTAGGGLYVDDCAGSVVRCDFVDNTAFAVDLPGDAAGFYSESSAMQVQWCTFTGNRTGAGGAGFYSFLQDTSVLEDCHFEDNESAFGGAIYLENSQATMRRCTVVGNTARQAGGVQIDAGSVCELVDVTFRDNVASQFSGGGLGVWESTVTLTDCVFQDNSANTNGGGLTYRAGVPLLEGCLFSGNVAGQRGGAIVASRTDLELSGCTLARNSAPEAGGISLRELASVRLDRTIVALSTSGESVVTDATSAVLATCTTIFGNAGGDWLADWADQLGLDGNTDFDPHFCDPLGGDFQLGSNSPCAPENNPDCGLIGALPVGCGPMAAPDGAATPPAPTLVDIRPNPFNPRTALRFDVPEPTHVRVSIHDLRGRLLRVLQDGSRPAGRHAVTWDGRDAAGHALPSGVYLAVIDGAGRRDARKLTLAR